MATIHQRGRGQLARVCQDGKMPLGPAVPWEKVTCFGCIFYTFIHTWKTLAEAMTTAFSGIGEFLRKAIENNEH